MKKFLKGLKLMLPLVLIFVTLGLTACNKKDSNPDLLNAVTEMEKGTYQLNNLKITYDQYNEKTQKYLTKYFPSLFVDGNVIYANKLASSIAGRSLMESDLKGMSLDELKKVGEPLKQSLDMNTSTFNYKSCEISKVYDDNKSSGSPQLKHIFVKRNNQLDDLKAPIYMHYTFIKEGKSYILQSFSNAGVMPNKELKFGDENVEFTQSINLE